MRNNIHQVVADNVKALMEVHGWRQHHLAEKAGLGQTTISYLTNPARGKVPRLDTISMVAEAFRVPAWTLLVEGLHVSGNAGNAADKLLRIYASSNESGRHAILRVADLESRYMPTHAVRISSSDEKP